MIFILFPGGTMQKKLFQLSSVIISLTLLISACNLPISHPVTGTTPAPVGASTNTPASQPVTPPSDSGSSPVPATVIPVYITYPSDPSASASTIQDQFFPSNSGDDYQTNLYERPFQLDNTYRPDADIVSVSLSADGQWYYFSTKMSDASPLTKMMDTPFGFELDFDRDGRGEILCSV